MKRGCVNTLKWLLQLLIVIQFSTAMMVNIQQSQQQQPQQIEKKNASKGSNYDDSYYDDLYYNDQLYDTISSYQLYQANNEDERCPLTRARDKILSWFFGNGSLTDPTIRGVGKENSVDLSHMHLSTDKELYNELLNVLKFYNYLNESWTIEIFSAAYNSLTEVPYETLSHPSIFGSLRFLSLAGNDFGTHETRKLIWATFPALSKLEELDLSACKITYLNSPAFKRLSNLRKLYLSHNMILRITQATFAHTPLLTYLDLSYWREEFGNVKLLSDDIGTLISGLDIAGNAFQNLKELSVLDLSHTKVRAPSFEFLHYLPQTLKILSLCYSGFPGVISTEFQNTSIKVLDLSHNPSAVDFLPQDAFIKIKDTLQFLFYENSNIKNLIWLSHLTKLQVLNLANNDIEILDEIMFKNLTDLIILELQNNHIINWHKCIFQSNNHLRLLDLRSNNLNILSTTLLQDFKYLDYLALSGNGFICNCKLNTLFESSANNKTSTNHLTSALDFDKYKYDFEIEKYMELIHINCLQPYHNLLIESRKNLRQMRLQRGPTFNFTKYKSAFNNHINVINPKEKNNEEMNIPKLHLQLLDYDSHKYYCYNYTKLISYSTLKCGKTFDIFENTTLHANYYINIIIGNVMAFLILCFLGVILYWKRWYIHYYYTSIKLAALWAFAAKSSNDKFLELKQEKPHLVYDIFISYCQGDRDWVLDELLPNIEKNEQISLCLHQRDFEIGVTIMENIVSSMDRSRALMLIVSQNSLLSHWCQFEMHLAQHRIIEAYKDHLILIFLENIPRIKRPKTLQYLMDVKTYINWPGKQKLDEQKIFWHRLKRSLGQIGLFETNT